MNKIVFTLATIFLLSFSFEANAATNSVAESVLNTTAAATTYLTGSTILDALIPSKKNCNYVTLKQYQPFSDIASNFPGIEGLMTKGKNNVDCVSVTNGTENLLKLLFTTMLSIIIVMTIISISVAGIQYMTEQATGKIDGGARRRLINSFVALILALLSYAILYTINKQLVNFTFNPGSIDVNGAIDRGIMDANIAALTSGQSSTLYDPARPAQFPPSITGWINPQTGAPCLPPAGAPTVTPQIPQTIPSTGPITFLKNRVSLLASVYFAADIPNPNAYVPTNGAYDPTNPFPTTPGAPNYLYPGNVTPPAATPTTNPCVEQSTLLANATPGSGINAQLTTKNGGAGEGTLSLEGVPYSFRSGPWGNGYLPIGTYTVTYGDFSIDGIRGRREEPTSMTVPAPSTYHNSMFGYSFNLSDKADPRNGGVIRSELRIHPDGYPNGTAGCIGIVGDLAVQERFFNQMTQLLAKNGGQYTITVN